MKIPESYRIAEYPDDFWPIEDEDVALNQSLIVPRQPLLHEPSEYCWCEPELGEYDEELEAWIYEHRWIVN